MTWTKIHVQSYINLIVS